MALEAVLTLARTVAAWRLGSDGWRLNRVSDAEGRHPIPRLVNEPDSEMLVPEILGYYSMVDLSLTIGSERLPEQCVPPW